MAQILSDPLYPGFLSDQAAGLRSFVKANTNSAGKIFLHDCDSKESFAPVLRHFLIQWMKQEILPMYGIQYDIVIKNLTPDCQVDSPVVKSNVEWRLDWLVLKADTNSVTDVYRWLKTIPDLSHFRFQVILHSVTNIAVAERILHNFKQTVLTYLGYQLDSIAIFPALPKLIQASTPVNLHLAKAQQSPLFAQGLQSLFALVHNVIETRIPMLSYAHTDSSTSLEEGYVHG